MAPISKWSISFWFLHRAHRHACHTPCPSNDIHTNTNGSEVQIMQFLALQLASSVLPVWCIH